MECFENDISYEVTLAQVAVRLRDRMATNSEVEALISCMTVFEDGFVKEVIKLKQSHMVGS